MADPQTNPIKKCQLNSLPERPRLSGYSHTHCDTIGSQCNSIVLGGDTRIAPTWRTTPVDPNQGWGSTQSFGFTDGVNSIPSLVHFAKAMDSFPPSFSPFVAEISGSSNLFDYDANFHFVAT